MSRRQRGPELPDAFPDIYFMESAEKFREGLPLQLCALACLGWLVGGCVISKTSLENDQLRKLLAIGSECKLFSKETVSAELGTQLYQAPQPAGRLAEDYYVRGESPYGKAGLRYTVYNRTDTIDTRPYGILALESLDKVACYQHDELKTYLDGRYERHLDSDLSSVAWTVSHDHGECFIFFSRSGAPQACVHTLSVKENAP